MQTRTSKRLAWGALALALSLAAVGMTFAALQGRAGPVVDGALLFVSFIAVGATGALIVSHLPRNGVGWMFLAAASGAALTFSSEQYATYALATHPPRVPGGVWAAWVGNWSWITFVVPLFVCVPLLFPDGRVPSPRWRPVARVIAIATAVVLVSDALTPGTLENVGTKVPNPAGIEGARTALGTAGIAGVLVLFVCLVLAAVNLFMRYRRSAGEERLRLRWFFYGVAALVAGFLLNIPLNLLFGDNSTVTDVVFVLGVAAVPVGAGVAILRDRLFDIDVVINRTIVVGALAAFVTLVYVALVVGIGALVVGSRANTFLTLLAAVVIAVAFQPVRARAQRFGNRLVFGKRATPYEVLSAFADHIGGGYAGEDLLAQMARTVGEGVGASAGYVWLRMGRDWHPTGVWPEGESPPNVATGPDGQVPSIPGADGVFPVRHEGELLGALSVAKPRGERLTQTEERLIGDLASQAGLVLRNVRLIEELRASRQRIVAASDAERRRLERNIHDGAQQLLVALAMKLRLAKNFARRDLDRAESLLEEVQTDAQEALDTLRDLARGIYPPLLADEGLAAALTAQARRAAIPVAVEADGIGRYPQDVEAAAYFCCLEAVQNAAKYGGGASVTISLGEESGTLRIRVADTGAGFDPLTTKPGAGLQNMRDGVEALGGMVEIASQAGYGTVVSGTIPIPSSWLGARPREP